MRRADHAWSLLASFALLPQPIIHGARPYHTTEQFYIKFSRYWVMTVDSRNDRTTRTLMHQGRGVTRTAYSVTAAYDTSRLVSDCNLWRCPASSTTNTQNITFPNVFTYRYMLYLTLYMRVKFEVRIFSRFKLVWLTVPLCTHRQEHRHTYRTNTLGA